MDPVTVCLIFAALIVKLIKVDGEYAKRGETPPGYGLVNKWLDGRKARGQAPADARPAQPGMWRYFWQRWRATWELAGHAHDLRHKAKLAQMSDAAARGELPASRTDRPTLKEQKDTAWQWVLDNLVSPRGENPPDAASKTGTPTEGPPGPKPDGPVITCDECGATLIDFAGGHVHPAGSTCSKAWAPAPTPNQPAAASADPTAPKGTGCPRCGGPVSRSYFNNLGLFCPVCDTTTLPSYYAGNKELKRRTCERCHFPGRSVCVKPRTERNDLGAETVEFIHKLTGTTDCPTQDQVRDHNAQLDRISTPHNTDADHRRVEKPTEGEPMPAGTQVSGEVTGIPSAIGYLEQVAQTHTAHAEEGQVLVARLGDMNVGTGDISQVLAAVERSQEAAELHKAAAESIRKSNAGVREGYASSPDAADKHAHQAG